MNRAQFIYCRHLLQFWLNTFEFLRANTFLLTKRLSFTTFTFFYWPYQKPKFLGKYLHDEEPLILHVGHL